MDSKIVLGRIIQILIEKKFSKYQSYNEFGFVSLRKNSILISREKGLNTTISFSKLIKSIEFYQCEIANYDKGPNALRDLDITHITSPIHSLLHLLSKEDFLI